MTVTNANYFAMFPLQETIWDKDGTGPLAAGIVSFYSDPAFTIPKVVYEQSNQAPYSFTNIGSVLVLSGIGSFVDGSGENFIPMLYPYSLPPTDPLAPGTFQPYFIKVVSSGNIQQFTVTNWPPNNFSIEETTITNSSTISNQITNPQFVEINVISPMTISLNNNSVTVPVAPGWFLSVSCAGIGTATVTQNSLTIDTPSNAPYSLEIALGSGVSGTLYQRIFNSPRLMAGDFISGYFEARSPTGAAIALSMEYSPSGSVAPSVPICQGVTTGSSFTVITGTVPINGAVNTDNASGYVDIIINLQTSTDVQLTSIQVLSVAAEADKPLFEEISTPLQKSGLYWYDKPNLEFKPIPSYLVGWDFRLNPAQFFGQTVAAQAVGANNGFYAWDQTIVFQTANSGVSVAPTLNGAIDLICSAGQVGLIQYLSGQKISTLLSHNLSVNIVGAAAGAVTLTISLWSTTNSAPPVLPSTFVTAIDANGYPGTSVVAGWTEVSRGTLGNATFTLPAIGTGSTLSSIGFNGWATTQAIAQGAKVFAIFIGTASLAGNSIAFESISLVPGDIPTIPAPKTSDETVRECQHYWQKSFFPTTIPANNAGMASGPTLAIQTVGAAATSAIAIRFPVSMRTTPVYPGTFYNPTSGTAGQILNFTTGASYSATSGSGSTSISANGMTIQGTSDGSSAAGNILAINWTVDARLGVV